MEYETKYTESTKRGPDGDYIRPSKGEVRTEMKTGFIKTDWEMELVPTCNEMRKIAARNRDDGVPGFWIKMQKNDPYFYLIYRNVKTLPRDD